MEKLLNAILCFLLLMAVDCWPFGEDPVTVPNAPVTALVGESVILPCHLSAEISAVEKEVRWYRFRNNKFSIVLSYVTKKSTLEIQDEEYSDRVNLFIQEMEKGNASLQMKNTAFSDEGEYKCCVISDNLHCKNVKLLVPVSLNITENVNAILGTSIILPCYLDPKVSAEDLELRWQKDGLATSVLLYKNTKVVTEEQHEDYRERVYLYTDLRKGDLSLVIEDVRIADEGKYTCSVKAVTQENEGSLYLSVSVKLKTSESTCLSEINKNVILPCHLDPAVSVLDSEVKWEKKGLTSPVFLYTNRRVALEEHHEQYKERTQLNSEDKRTGDLSLSLKNVKVTDEGRYTCSVKAHGREIQASLDLSVTAQGGKPAMTVDEEPGNVKLKCISRGWYPKPQLKWTREDGSAVTEYSELFEEVEHDGRITITSYLSIRDQYDQKILCIVQLSGSKERAVSSIINSRGRPQHFAHLVALICMILVLCYIIMCKKGYAQIKSMFFELFT
uniref:Ig-like domain-containing protein n=1 Tax=Erpetoichthys calabaricus TaxID=27687 RepID=A0A8C4TIH2_ERPCA